MMKICRHCGEEKLLEEFYRHRQMLDGHLNVCKPCVRARVRRHRRENDHVREYDRSRYQEPARKSKSLANGKAWRHKNPQARRAHDAVANALRNGRLEKSPCVFCGSSKNLHAHHHDYSSPLDVIWLCAKCHHRLHALFPEVEGQNKVEHAS